MTELTGKALLKLTLVMLAFVVISASATNITIQRTTVQAQLGRAMLFIYYEKANAPSGSTPTVDTGTTQPTTSGSYTITSTTSGRLWTPLYTSTTSIPAGDWTFNIWEASSRSGTITVSVYTTNTAGTTVSTIISSATINVVTAKTEAVATFPGSAGTIPSGGGYIEVILRVPSGSSARVTIYWGSGQLTNFQLQYP